MTAPRTVIPRFTAAAATRLCARIGARASHAAAWGVVALALGAVFMLYTRPGLMLTLSQQLWSCFGGA